MMFTPSIFGDNLFDGFFDGFARPAKNALKFSVPAVNPMPTDVKETETGYELAVSLPGYKKDDIRAQIEDGYLTIEAKAETTNETQDEDGRYVRRERSFGSCKRSFYVGDQVTSDEIKGSFENGILTLFVPKKDPQITEKEPNLITING